MTKIENKRNNKNRQQEEYQKMGNEQIRRIGNDEIRGKEGRKRSQIRVEVD